MIVLREDPLLKGSLRFNLLNQRIDIVRKLWWNDGIISMTDAARDFFYLYFEQFYSLGNEKNMDKALRAEANSKQYHPICEYLNRLEWDGTERIRYVLKSDFSDPLWCHNHNPGYKSGYLPFAGDCRFLPSGHKPDSAC